MNGSVSETHDFQPISGESGPFIGFPRPIMYGPVSAIFAGDCAKSGKNSSISKQKNSTLPQRFYMAEK
jgi:hypothetical protein